ncbi:MAG TPA: efflux RND transporter periplasmic adaptor subunit [bacterium]|nr:efflux RND transporter periplasmic adaptor subunit [bacterium]HPQ66719.1 efflux RND transporter periplasmic adaptor subunit [bacterium]
MKKFKVAIIILIVLAGAAAAVRFLVLKDSETENGDTVSLVRPRREDLQMKISVTGIVEPQNRLEIKPTIGGRIEEVLVREGQEVKRGDRLALMSSTDRATLLDAAQLNGPEKVAYWEEVYKPSPLLAPIDGTVIVRGVEPGQTVTTSSVVLVLSDRLIVKAEVDETDIGMVKLGQDAFITLDAYPEQSIPATVDHIAYESTVVSNVTIYKVDILPRRTPATFRSGMSAEVSIVTAVAADALTVPSDAVQTGRRGSKYVLVPGPEGEPQRREVETGIEADGRIQILSGLEPDQEVVAVSREYRLSSGNAANGGSPFLPNRRRSSSSSSSSSSNNRRPQRPPD